MSKLVGTPGQTVGPFFHYGMPFLGGPQIAEPHSPGAIVLTGRVLDGEGQPIPDAMVEIWQRDADGSIPRARSVLRRENQMFSNPVHRESHGFTGFGRAATDDHGVYRFWTVNPGAGDDGSAPFFAAIVFARGLLNKLHTRIYLPENADALGADPLLSVLTDDERATMVATRDERGWLHHDIRLQGDGETVFLAFN
ncbi:protocatechuate 3,4-dioxygenase subunit alpha [Ruicaihuangia caeni]|uniref:Protocatechuate 3,4-dioxygenase subunit alpha n=1 Tax=Ruicaihuangia caeni TaxID=3042517 RepID=A0AAW6T648_9MICO|nr:protocatechuate 3,4-dioxygenase subunit alpha [Klugiella sp. YN-L-19]MDI2099305.1 protocatechuate 3,4-dioxygenase subunit alpha [Klugiella sp. YN-L-19]